jgi:DNA-directed RNA polymerase specialized sigma24 family protein
MGAIWEEIHRDLIRHVASLSARQPFRDLAQVIAAPILKAAPEDPIALVEYLRDRTIDADDRGCVLGRLVVAARKGERHAAIASSILWLALWPALDGIFRRLVGRGRPPEEVASDIAAAFLERIDRIDLQRVGKLAATLVRSTERDVIMRRQRDRRWSAIHLGGQTLDEESVAIEPLDPRSWRLESDDVVALARWVEAHVGHDAEIVMRAVVDDECQRILAARVGLSHEALRKRLQRALRRLRAVLAANDNGIAVPNPDAPCL